MLFVAERDVAAKDGHSLSFDSYFPLVGTICKWPTDVACVLTPLVAPFY